MAVVIRLKRTGRRNRPCYRISVADSRWKRDGRALDTLGLYDPIAPTADAQSTMNVERARHWLSEGAKPSETVHSLFKRHGVYEGEHELGKAPNAKARKGRRKTTKRGERRAAEKADRTEKKTARRTERLAARKAAAAASGGDEE